LRTTAGSAAIASPATRQPARSEHETTSTLALAAGIGTEFHVSPPFDVTTSNAAARLSWATIGLGPTATQLVAETHDTDRRTPVPPLTSRRVQERPPSKLTTIDAPTATQKVALGQSTDPRAPTDDGTVGAFQVVPPSKVTSSWPARGPPIPGETPTVTHRVGVGQLTPKSDVLAVGTDDVFQVAPASSERTDTP